MPLSACSPGFSLLIKTAACFSFSGGYEIRRFPLPSPVNMRSKDFLSHIPARINFANIQVTRAVAPQRTGKPAAAEPFSQNTGTALE